MHFKGFLEWRILAAIFAVLVVLSSVLVTSTGIKDLFFNTTKGFGDSLKGSPLDWFSSLFSTPQKGVNTVEIKVMTDNITLNIEKPANITYGKTNIANFKGVVTFDFMGKSSTFLPVGSDIRLETELAETRIKSVHMPVLIMNNIDFVVTSEKTNITASNEKIEIYDFFGDLTVTYAVLFSGNVTKVKDEKWSIG
jgi:hypothetical protein